MIKRRGIAPRRQFGACALRKRIAGSQENGVHIYPCVHPELVWCRLKRNGLDEEKDYTFVAVLGGCNRPCHHTPNGGDIPSGAWVPPEGSEPIGTLHAIRLEKMEDEQGDDTWLL